MNKDIWKSLLHRPSDTHKYDYGHILIVGGSESMTGAPVLAARAALRTGAGLTTIASTKDTVDLIDRDIEEIMMLSLPEWRETTECLTQMQAFIASRHVTTVIIGPGLPSEAHEVIRILILHLRIPIILDAAAFTALSGHLEVLRKASRTNKAIVLTPHPGEYNRLLRDHKEYPEGLVGAFAHDYGITVALKQHPTLVVSADGKIYRNTTGNPGLATAGSGDVLAGIMAGILAQKVPSYDAAIMAVYLHGLAGDEAAKRETQPGMIASDIIEAIPKALHTIDNNLDRASGLPQNEHLRA